VRRVRSTRNKIVYRVSKTAAAAAVIAQRRMETTAADAKVGNGKKDEASDQNAVACIAGCYANQDISPEMKPRRAAAAGPNARVVHVAAVTPAAKPQPEFALAGAHRISAETRGHLAKKRITNAIRETHNWRTKIVFATRQAARLAAKRDRALRPAIAKMTRNRVEKRNKIVTEASGFIF
jgi:hypothetical protein